MSQEPYCDHGPLDACPCLARRDVVEQISAAFRFSESEAAAAGVAAREVYAETYAGAEQIAVGAAGPEREPGADAENMHVYAHEFDPIGGFVCGECGTPTESEPCPDHQPIAYSKIT